MDNLNDSDKKPYLEITGAEPQIIGAASASLALWPILPSAWAALPQSASAAIQSSSPSAPVLESSARTRNLLEHAPTEVQWTDNLRHLCYEMIHLIHWTGSPQLYPQVRRWSRHLGETVLSRPARIQTKGYLPMTNHARGQHVARGLSLYSCFYFESDDGACARASLAAIVLTWSKLVK
jgi:hypothetical protein